MKLSWLISRLSPTAAAVAVLTCAPQAAHAQSISVPDQGKLLLTGGVIEVDGAGGGGLVPWAMITGYGTRDSVGANAHETFVNTSDFPLNSYGPPVWLLHRGPLPFPPPPPTPTPPPTALPSHR